MYFLDTHNTLWYLAVDSWYVIARCRSKAVSPVSHSSDRGGIFFSLQRWVVSVCLKWSWHWLIRQDVGQNGTEQHNQPVHRWYLHWVMYSGLKIMTNESFCWYLLVKTLYATRRWRGGSVLQVFEVRCAALHDVEGKRQVTTACHLEKVLHALMHFHGLNTFRHPESQEQELYATSW